ncbi:cytochrome o ubiquinol oxidase subunit IV [Agaricicola taiwanensis]|uniref:Cytochrome bo(3) ubiquinol oxidase subunit 4 n=1 Tax=Agaricicola taiwanensis TaxID=591372 RepID=A0A8J2VLQ5_9RHOB|nr:cytochrome o ubiquinol oxidase subunit IV [Agaricicola taiwanensis]GGE32013.1 cytochrome o ubiquinol oxidase subunit IV [Agaricicola taiwanensis]
MSATVHNEHGHDHGHDDHGDGHAHGTFKSYMVGFVLSVILTAIPFWLVMEGVLADANATALTIMGFAVVQIVVHMVFFLHMTPKAEEGWNMMALIFTLIVVVIILAGSLWVMYHLNTNMMPGVHDMNRM